jgi:hypothetical protein
MYGLVIELLVMAKSTLTDARIFLRKYVTLEVKKRNSRAK